MKKVPSTCTFCQKPVASVKSWVSHIGNHLEQISVWVLPRTIFDHLDDKDAERSNVTGPASSNLVGIGDTMERADLPDSKVPVASLGNLGGSLQALMLGLEWNSG